MTAYGASLCRTCKSKKMEMFLSLGLQPPANGFLKKEDLKEKEEAWPVDIYACLDCALIQIPNRIPDGFFRNYVYVPSASDTMHSHFLGLAETIQKRFLKSPSALTIDIGSNDGLFLKSLKDLGGRTLGIDPATNLCEIARGKGLEVVNDYFGPATARKVREKFGPATVMVTTNTFNHVDDLHSFVEGVTICLGDKGVFIIEVPHALDLVEKNEFDTVYHEHLSQFSVKSIVDLFGHFEMEVFDIESLPIHGGSMRIFGRKTGQSNPLTPVVTQWIEREKSAQLFSLSTYQAFSKRVERNRENTLNLLKKLRKEGKRIVGYGAPAKGNSLLNYYQIGPELLDYLVDRNSLKHHLYSPGMHLQVLPVEKIQQDKPDYLFLLAWNFADEIMGQQEAFRRGGGKFILPIPEPKIVN